MSGFVREYSGSFAFSVLLHGLLVAALILAAVISANRPPDLSQPLPIDAVVVDSTVLRAAQKAEEDRVAQAAAEKARIAAAANAAAEAKAAADAQAAEQAKAELEAKAVAEAKAAADAKTAANAKAAADSKAAADAKVLADAKVAADAAKAAAAAKARQQAEADLAAQARREAEAKKAAEAKAAVETKAKADADAKAAADDRARKDREAELRNQLADEEHRNQVASGPLSASYIARLRARIQNAWIKPPSATAGLDCLVAVTQVPGGEVTGARVTQCNGDAAARQSIENAVYRASPLPDPPDPALFERNFVIRFKPDE